MKKSLKDYWNHFVQILKDNGIAITCFIFIFVLAVILHLFGILESFQQFVVVIASAAATYIIVCVTMSSQSEHQAKMQQLLASEQSKLQQQLMEKQSEKEAAKDKDIRIYEKKLEVYSDFNEMLWNLSDNSFEKVKEFCLKQLIFVISETKLDKLHECLKEVNDNYDTEDEVRKSYAKLTALLREDLQDGVESDYMKILRIFTAITKKPTEEKNIIDNSSDLKRPETINIWNKYHNNEIGCWHFNALDVAIQKQALEGKNMLLSLIEYDECWRTERLKQVQKGDAVFLFNRGGVGYVGLYRATGTIVLRREDKKILMSEDCGQEKEITMEEAEKYDIYCAIGDGATLVSAIKVEPILLRNHSWNPIGTMRQTIVRPNPDNVWELLKYFDKEDK